MNTFSEFWFAGQIAPLSVLKHGLILRASNDRSGQAEM